MEIDLIKITPSAGDLFVLRAGKVLDPLERQELIRRFLAMTQQLHWPQIGVVYLDAGTDISVISQPTEATGKEEKGKNESDKS